MNIGLPGTGIGGLFYLLLASLMPAHALWTTACKRAGASGWRTATRHSAIASMIVFALWVESWGLHRALACRVASHRGKLPSSQLRPPRRSQRSSLPCTGPVAGWRFVERRAGASDRTRHGGEGGLTPDPFRVPPRCRIREFSSLMREPGSASVNGAPAPREWRLQSRKKREEDWPCK